MKISLPSDRRLLLLASCALIGLFVKFLWPLFLFDLPLGYDPGFYRYLFLRHAEGLPPFFIADLPPWAKGHPLGLFFLTSPLIRLGLPVDWLIGWMWNVFAVLTAAVSALAARRRYGDAVGVCTLLAALLSVAYFDGFAAMYWKTFASLFWCVLAFSALERRSYWSIPLGILAVATHHQTGLLFGLTLLSWVLLPFLPFGASVRRSPGSRLTPRRFLLLLALGCAIFLAGLLLYLPVWQEAVMQHLPALLGQVEVTGGSFPPASYYLRTEGILLLLGAYGFFLNIRRERFTLWQLAVVWSFLFVALRLLFYRRFFLQLDFFLLPFAGIAIVALWSRFRSSTARAALGILLAMQALFMGIAIARSGPIVDEETFDAVRRTAETVEHDATVLSLENDSVVVLRGWLPYRHIGGPGLFESSWSVDRWETFLLGSTRQRAELLAGLPRPLYLFATPHFRSYYGYYAERFLRDPCLEHTDIPMLYRVVCPPAQP